MIKRSSKHYIDKLIKHNPDWKILDIGCGYTAHERASVVCDIKDLSEFYKDKKFIKLENETLPFNNNEFDFVISSHVIEHVKNVDKFINELQRISSKGYIELPSILEDNLVFENKKDHLWHCKFDDDKNNLLISKRVQYIEPILTVSSIKNFSKFFRESLILELYWENSIEYKVLDEDVSFEKISRLSLLRKFISKLLRNIIRKN